MSTSATVGLAEHEILLSRVSEGTGANGHESDGHQRQQFLMLFSRIVVQILA